ncbi:interferon regulatory factor 2 isoform X2 [Ostrea edulis]|uniref:interferon regulatory factor 2 isoform X2 n=1 Tax=Ostrea edulis TaxID=37623 RepID=UPI0024AF038A|nr:interferon regulatory factor 2 isoform X2 [Ostrea edulis]
MGMDNIRQTGGIMTKKRPVERQKMRPWIQDMLDNGGVQGLEWFDKSQNLFRINWKHGSRHGFNTTKDASLFEKYAQHTGRWDPNDLNPKKWKANFRCALNSLQNVMEVKNLGESKGAHAYRVYQFLLEEETKPKDGHQRKHNKKKPDKGKSKKLCKFDDATDEEPEKETLLISKQEIDEPMPASDEEAAAPQQDTPLLTKRQVDCYTYQHHMAGCIVIQSPRKRPAPYSTEKDDCEDPVEMTSLEDAQLMAHAAKRNRSTDDDESLSYSQLSVTDESSNISCTSDSSSSSPGEETDNVPHFSNLLSDNTDGDWVIESEETVTTTDS